MNATLIEARLSLNVSHSKIYKYADTRGRHVTLQQIFTLQKQLINTVHLLSTSASFTFSPRYSRLVSRIKFVCFFYLYLLFFTQSYRWRRRGEEGSGKKLQKKIVPQFFRDRLARWAVVTGLFSSQVIHTSKTSACSYTQQTLPPAASGLAAVPRSQVTHGETRRAGRKSCDFTSK